MLCSLKLICSAPEHSIYYNQQFLACRSNQEVHQFQFLVFGGMCRERIMKCSPCLARMPILAIVLLSGLTYANAAGATADVIATVKLGNSSYTDLLLADAAEEQIVNHIRGFMDSLPWASTNMDGLYRSTQDDVVIANASITIEGTQ
ncbi:hypothetical protein DUNSADRAFT_13555, partial [Dunaliella salina]